MSILFLLSQKCFFFFFSSVSLLSSSFSSSQKIFASSLILLLCFHVPCFSLSFCFQSKWHCRCLGGPFSLVWPSLSSLSSLTWVLLVRRFFSLCSSVFSFSYHSRTISRYFFTSSYLVMSYVPTSWRFGVMFFPMFSLIEVWRVVFVWLVFPS